MSTPGRNNRQARVAVFLAWLGAMVLILVKVDDLAIAIGFCVAVTVGLIGLIKKINEIDRGH